MVDEYIDIRYFDDGKSQQFNVIIPRAVYTIDELVLAINKELSEDYESVTGRKIILPKLVKVNNLMRWEFSIHRNTTVFARISEELAQILGFDNEK